LRCHIGCIFSESQKRDRKSLERKIFDGTGGDDCEETILFSPTRYGCSRTCFDSESFRVRITVRLRHWFIGPCPCNEHGTLFTLAPDHWTLHREFQMPSPDSSMTSGSLKFCCLNAITMHSLPPLPKHAKSSPPMTTILYQPSSRSAPCFRSLCQPWLRLGLH
jgi:hypothetical protein